jgi:hypothetical protein
VRWRSEGLLVAVGIGGELVDIEATSLRSESGATYPNSARPHPTRLFFTHPQARSSPRPTALARSLTLVA